jgi:uncharacterized membrane protein YphA (DoxX/SURF4 family)
LSGWTTFAGPRKRCNDEGGDWGMPGAAFEVGMKGQFAAAVAAFPLTFADLLVIGGLGTVLYGVFLLWGIPPTLIAAGLALLWIGGRLYGPDRR